jgi:FlaA1/EpsC-like NDP-sugar epimerase
MSVYSRLAELQARGQPAPLLLMVDLAAALIAFSLSALLRANLTIANQVPLELEIPIGVYLAIAFAWILGGTLLGLYRSERPSNSRDVRFLLVANALINLVAVFSVSVFSMPIVPRLMYVFFPVLLICLLFLLRATLQVFAASPLHYQIYWIGSIGVNQLASHLAQLAGWEEDPAPPPAYIQFIFCSDFGIIESAKQWPLWRGVVRYLDGTAR